jgi:hypothetical protein
VSANRWFPLDRWATGGGRTLHGVGTDDDLCRRVGNAVDYLHNFSSRSWEIPEVEMPS